MLISSCLTNCESWFNTSTKEIEYLSKLDKIFFSRLTGIAKTAPSESWFLEFGVLNFEQYIKGRRILYYHSLVNREKRQLVYKIFLTQYLKRTRDNWVNKTLEDFKDLKICTDFSYLENISKNKFKKVLKERLKDFAFKYFIGLKNNHSKMKYLSYSELKMQDYLTDEKTTLEDKKVALKWRIFMEDFGENFRGGRLTTLCPLCKSHADSQNMSFECQSVKNTIQVQGCFDQLFEETIDPCLLKTINKISKLRREISNK